MADFPSKFCTTREAAVMLGVSVTTTQNWAEAGLLDSWKTEGGHRRITRSSVERLLNKPHAQWGVHGRPTRQKTSGQHLHILVIEENPKAQESYRKHIQTWSCTPIIEMANDGFEALVKIGVHCPDLLITDLDIAHIDGFSMLNALAVIPTCQHMHIVILSDMSAEKIRESGKLPESSRVLSKTPLGLELQEIALQLTDAKRQRLRDQTSTK